MTKVSAAFPPRLWGRKKILNACLGLPTHRTNCLNMLEFAKKNLSNQLPLLYSIPFMPLCLALIQTNS
jgi:hypothetical protein